MVIESPDSSELGAAAHPAGIIGSGVGERVGMEDDGKHQEHAWVSATATRNHVLRNPSMDWLDLYGEAKGYIREPELPNYDERLEFVPGDVTIG